MGKSYERLIGVSELKLEFLETDDDMDIHSKLPSMCSASELVLIFDFSLLYLCTGEWL